MTSPDGAEGPVLIHADARIYAGLFDGSEAAQMTLDSALKSYIHVVQGKLDVNRTHLSAGDAATLEGESLLEIRGGEAAEVLVFDLAPV